MSSIIADKPVSESTPAAEITVVNPQWRRALPVFGSAVAALLAFYWQTLAGMAAIWWRSDTFAHGMVMVPIALWLIWRRREPLARLEPGGSRIGLALLGLLALGWLAAYAAGVLAGQQFMLVAMIGALVWTVLGWPVTRTIAFPLAYLFFAVPFGEFLIAPLQDFTAWFSVAGLRLTGIPVFWEGYYIHIPSGDFEVAEACSGLRYLIASLALGTLYAYLSYRSLWRRLAFIALAILLPIVANGIRAYGIVILAHVSGGRLATGVDHIIYGWFFFGLVMLFLFWLGSFWQETGLAPAPAAAIPARPGRFPAVIAGDPLLTAGLAALLVAGIGPLGAAWLEAGGSSENPIALKVPAAVAPWGEPVPAGADWQPVFAGAGGVLHQRYQAGEDEVDLYIAYYPQQRQGAELINSRNSLYDGKRWVYVSTAGRSVTLADDTRRLDVSRIGSGAYQRLIYHWYWVGGWNLTSPVAVKLLEAWDRLSHLGRGSALIAVSTPVKTTPADAEAVLTRFLTAMAPGIEQTLWRGD